MTAGVTNKPPTKHGIWAIGLTGSFAALEWFRANYPEAAVWAEHGEGSRTAFLCNLPTLEGAVGGDEARSLLRDAQGLAGGFKLASRRDGLLSFSESAPALRV